ncbi:MAG: hypothetical protein ACP5NA_02585 [Candidatus Acidulodesulfobacterium sp.]
MKLKKFLKIFLLTCIFGFSAGLMLSGCSGANQTLEKDHIMNDGCFITCYNKTHSNSNSKAYSGKHIGIKHNSAVKNIFG